MKKKAPKADYDSPWKEAIGLYFESFLEFFYPHIWADIDWSQGYTMLDKELQKIVGSAAIGRREVDALVRVTRLSGVEQWVLIKFRLVRGLICDSGLTREEIGGFFRLVDWVLALPKEIEYAFEEDLANLAEERNMVYITSIERIYQERGEAKGMAEGVRKSILQVIKSRWGVCEPELVLRLEGIADADRLSALLDAALTADSPEHWKQKLD